jgi:hypothetical protein
MWRFFPQSSFASADAAHRVRLNAAVDVLVRRWRSWLSHSLQREGIARSSIATRGVATVLSQLHGSELLVLDRRLRNETWAVDSEERQVASELDEHAFLFCAACNRDGFVREQALKAFRTRPGQLATAAALIRMEDWVPQVQRAACFLLPVASDGGRRLFQFLDLLVQLQQKKRATPEIWAEYIDSALIAPENRELRWAATRGSIATARRLAYSLVLRADPDWAAAALGQAIDDDHPGIARWAIDNLSAVRGGEQLELLQSAVRHCRFASARSAALRAYVGARAPDVRATLLAAVLDRSFAPRSAAAYLLQREFGMSALPVWRAAIDAGASDAALALLSLADTAEGQDIDRLRSFLGHPKAAIRAAVLRGLSRAEDPEILQHLNRALRDASTVVIRQALATLHRRHETPGISTLTEAFDAATTVHARAALASAAHSLGKWEALEFLLDHALRADDATWPIVETGLRVWWHWENRRFSTASPTTIERLRTLVGQLRSNPRAEWRDFDQVLRSQDREPR